MANKTIGELTAAAALDGTELAHIVQGGNSRRTTVGAMASAFKWMAMPIGQIYFVDTSLTGVEIPPSAGGFIELTAGLTGPGQYNESKLTSESVTASGTPLAVATAVIDDVASPMNGQTIHLLNSEERVLYAGERAKSGDVFNDQMQQITGSVRNEQSTAIINVFGLPDGAFSMWTTGSQTHFVPRTAVSQSGSPGITFDSANSPGARTGDRTRAKGQFLVAFLKYKDVV